MRHVKLVFSKLGVAAVAVKCFVTAKIGVVAVLQIAVFFQDTEAGKLLLAVAAEKCFWSSMKVIAHLKKLALPRQSYQQLGKAAELVGFYEEAQVATEENGQRLAASGKAHALPAGR